MNGTNRAEARHMVLPTMMLLNETIIEFIILYQSQRRQRCHILNKDFFNHVRALVIFKFLL